MNADGTNPTRLTNNASFDAFSTWSPDGRHIAFTAFQDRDGEIYVMDADGGDQTRITFAPGFDQRCDWGRGAPWGAPDDRRAFSPGLRVRLLRSTGYPTKQR